MAATETPVMFLHGIECRYAQGDATLDILKGAELAVWPGQSIALIAPSGAGKSTLLHIAGLLEQPDAGEVYINDRATSTLGDAERTRIRRNDIGFVYQAHHLLPEFTAQENVMLPQMLRGLAPPSCWAISASRSGSPIGRPSFPAASSSASPSPARSPMRRVSCSPTSRP